MPPKYYNKRYPSARFTGKTGGNSGGSEMLDRKAKYLIIVESPSKCNKIEEYLGKDYHCIASKGHIREIDGLKSIDTKRTFEPTFGEIQEKQSHIKNMRTVIAKYDPANVILATDDDREGEAIAWHICQISNLPVETTKRILFREITQTAIQEAVANPTVINMPLVNAQKARQVLDIIVGFKISPYLWKFINSNSAKTLSAGRCQTPALRLIYDNDCENKKSQMVTQYKVRASFTSKHLVFDLNHEFDMAENVLAFMEKSRGFNHLLHVGIANDSKKSAPKPFNTSRLLQAANNQLHMTTKETMNHCQQLYQLGYITYMRTESSQYSPVFLAKMKEYVLKTWGDGGSSGSYLGDFDRIENKDTTKPHEAIRITNIKMTSLTADDSRLTSLYRLIWKNTVESCMSDALYKNTPVKVSGPDDTVYTHIVEVPLFLGWKVVTAGVSAAAGLIGETEKQSGLLLFLKSIEQAGKPVSHNYIESEMVARNKHSYYTEAGIIQKLEELGIGRPSTFSSIVDTIQERGYVKRKNIEGKIVKSVEYRLEDGKIGQSVKERTFGAEKSKLCIEPLGIIALQFLLKYFETFFSYEYTKHMEDQLDAVVFGCDWSEICRMCYSEIKVLSKPVNEIAKKEYPIGAGGGAEGAGAGAGGPGTTYVFTFNKFGPVIKVIEADGAASPPTTEEKTKYIPVKNGIDIDMDRLKQGLYTLDDLAEISFLGEYEGHKVYVKTGRYGNYIEYGDVTKSIKSIKKPVSEITWIDIEPFLEDADSEGDEGGGNSSSSKKRGILRTLNSCMSVRNGKFGSYVYYKTPQMTKPQFLNIKHFPEGFMFCQPEVLVEWICKTYNIRL